MTGPTDTTAPVDETLVFSPFDRFHLTSPRCRRRQVKRGSVLVNLATLGSMGCSVVVALHRRRTAMRRCLVEKLACPECRGDIEVAEVCEENAIRILRGTLRCTSCSKRYPIDKGVPRLVKVADDVAEVCRRYS